MYASSADDRSGLMVGVYRGARIRDEEYARCVASILASDANAASRQVTHACVLVTDSDAPSPPPIWRQRMAEANNHLSAQTYYFALVTPKLVIRGVFTAVVWLTRKRPGHHFAAFADLAQASLWLERSSGHPALAVRRLYESAQSQLLPDSDSVAVRGVKAG